MCAAKGDPVTLAAAIAMYEGQDDAAEAVAEAKVELSRLEKVIFVTAQLFILFSCNPTRRNQFIFLTGRR